jgi:hypothetical protein
MRSQDLRVYRESPRNIFEERFPWRLTLQLAAYLDAVREHLNSAKKRALLPVVDAMRKTVSVHLRVNLLVPFLTEQMMD